MEGGRGFTLVELIIVVAVIGILTSIAIPYYLNFQTRAKQAEARANIGAIRSSFFAYFAENDNVDLGAVGTLRYDVGDNTGTPFGQSSLARGANLRWNPSTSFSRLGFNAEGAVYFNYSFATNALTGSAASFTAMASADLDKNGALDHIYLNERSEFLRITGDTF